MGDIEGEEDIIHEKQDEKYLLSEVDFLHSENNTNECKKLRSSIQEVIERNISILSQNEYDNFRIEYGQIIKGSVFSKDNDDV